MMTTAITAPGTISAVVPLYNKGPHVERALHSILDQEHGPDEIIVVDDGSSDDGLQKVLRLVDPRLRVVQRSFPGAGGYAARNLGIELAASEWIAFLDADDTWMPGAVREVRRLLAGADDNVSCAFSAYVSDYGNRIVRERRCPAGRLDFDAFIRSWLTLGRSPMWTSTVVARRTSLIEAGLFPAGLCERGGDKDTWLRLLSVGDALCSDRVTATYYRNSVNMVTKTTELNVRPQMCGTLELCLPASSGETERAVKRLINWEMFCQARAVWRDGGRVDPIVFEGFFVEQSPLLYLVTAAMAHGPAWALKLSRWARSWKTSLRKITAFAS
jgi:glycosyltransferase involved in cell wall biosynthesis